MHFYDAHLSLTQAKIDCVKNNYSSYTCFELAEKMVYLINISSEHDWFKIEKQNKRKS